MRGKLHLSFARRAENTVLHLHQQDPPWRVIRGFSNATDAATLVHLHNVSGGVLSGDELDLQLDLAPHAHAQLTTTSATRLYGYRTGTSTARSHIQFHLAEHSLLEYLPDPLIPFATAQYEQRTEIHLAPHATLFAWDVLSPGREAAGEVFAYERLLLETRICSPDGPLYWDRALLEPALRPLTSLARYGDFRYLATLLICRPNEPAATWLQLEETLAALAAQRSETGAVRWGVSALARHGLVVRGLGHASRFLLADLTTFWSTAKHLLCGQAAVLPRKLY